MLSGMGPGGGGTDRFASRDDVVKAVRGLVDPDVVAMLDAGLPRVQCLAILAAVDELIAIARAAEVPAEIRNNFV